MATPPGELRGRRSSPEALEFGGCRVTLPGFTCAESGPGGHPAPAGGAFTWMRWLMDRMLRVNELLKRELGQEFERLICGRVSCLVTVTELKTAPDLRTAIVYVSVYGTPEQKTEVMRLLAEERTELQRRINRHVKLKFTPKLDFRLDEHLDRADRIFQIIEHLEEDTAREQDS
jgi:ribosome-binding factor A